MPVSAEWRQRRHLRRTIYLDAFETKITTNNGTHGSLWLWRIWNHISCFVYSVRRNWKEEFAIFVCLLLQKCIFMLSPKWQHTIRERFEINLTIGMSIPRSGRRSSWHNIGHECIKSRAYFFLILTDHGTSILWIVENDAGTGRRAEKVELYPEIRVDGFLFTGIQSLNPLNWLKLHIRSAFRTQEKFTATTTKKLKIIYQKSCLTLCVCVCCAYTVHSVYTLSSSNSSMYPSIA